MDKTESLLDWIDKEIDIMERYHNHKELMAWTATAFFLPAVVIFCYSAAPHVAGSAIRIVMAVVVALLGVVAALFINMQFEMRWKASDDIEALKRCRVHLTLNPEMIQGFPTKLPETSPKNKHMWPQFIEEEMEKCRVDRTVKLFFQAFPDLIKLHWTQKDIDARLRTELASYLALLLATVSAIVTLLIPRCA